MQQGTVEIFIGIALILVGCIALKVTDLDYWWGSIALGAVIGSKGGVSISQRARV